MKPKLSGKKVAILVADGFEQSELTTPREALERAGAEVHLLAPAGEKVRAWDQEDWGDTFRVAAPLKRANVEDYDCLVLPGGVLGADKLRRDPRVLDFVRAFFDEGKPVAVMGHAVWTLIDAGLVAGRQVTSWPSIQADIRNADAEWLDEPVVVDNGLLTSRKPADIPVFCRKMVEEFAFSKLHVPRIRMPSEAFDPEVPAQLQEAEHSRLGRDIPGTEKSFAG